MSSSVGESIRDARRRAGLTQVELARRADIPATVLCVYEGGRREPAASTYLAIMAAAGVVPVWRRQPDVAVCAERLLEVLDLAEALPYRPRPLSTARAPWTA